MVVLHLLSSLDVFPFWFVMANLYRYFWNVLIEPEQSFRFLLDQEVFAILHYSFGPTQKLKYTLPTTHIYSMNRQGYLPDSV